MIYVMIHIYCYDSHVLYDLWSFIYTKLTRYAFSVFYVVLYLIAVTVQHSSISP